MIDNGNAVNILSLEAFTKMAILVYKSRQLKLLFKD